MAIPALALGSLAIPLLALLWLGVSWSQAPNYLLGLPPMQLVLLTPTLLTATLTLRIVTLVF